MGFASAVKSGDRAKALVALRDLLADQIEGADERSVASLAKQLRETMAELDALPKVDKGTASDDLARRRADRLAAAKAAAPATADGVDERTGGR